MNAPAAFLARPPSACPAASVGFEPWRARLDLAFAAGPMGTRLTRRAHEGPLRVQRALYPEGPEVCHVVIVHPPGGVAGGDRLSIDVQLEQGAHALLTTPGAAKWYKCAGRDASQSVNLQLAADARLEWLPQEAIVFDAAQARWRTRIALGEGARYVGWDIVCLGRAAAGEQFAQGRLNLGTEIWRGDRLLWTERGQIEGGSPWQQQASGLGGDTVWGTLAFAGTGASAEHRDQVRALSVLPGVRLGVTLLPEVLLVRAMGCHIEAVRAALQSCWSLLRPALMNTPSHLPRIWAT